MQLNTLQGRPCRSTKPQADDSCLQSKPAMQPPTHLQGGPAQSSSSIHSPREDALTGPHTGQAGMAHAAPLPRRSLPLTSTHGLCLFLAWAATMLPSTTVHALPQAARGGPLRRDHSHRRLHMAAPCRHHAHLQARLHLGRLQGGPREAQPQLAAGCLHDLPQVWPGAQLTGLCQGTCRAREVALRRPYWIPETPALTCKPAFAAGKPFAKPWTGRARSCALQHGLILTPSQQPCPIGREHMQSNWGDCSILHICFSTQTPLFPVTVASPVTTPPSCLSQT